MKTIISRSEAQAKGLAFYFTGKPCPEGHITDRRVSTCHCLGCQFLQGHSERPDIVRHARPGLPKPTRPRPSNCECCGTPETSKRKLALDHDHTTNKFRGWLCFDCNTSIGKLGDDVESLKRALAYLERAMK